MRAVIGGPGRARPDSLGKMVFIAEQAQENQPGRMPEFKSGLIEIEVRPNLEKPQVIVYFDVSVISGQY